METLWFLLVAVMLVGYVVLDGFDLGVGLLHRWVARTPDERAVVRQAIGPVWDANEVWLLAAGGTLYFAFPPLYASGFSGFYLPLMMVLWMLIGRALGLELAGHVGDPLLREVCDTIFSVCSILLMVFLGAAFGNVLRGVPLDAEGYFFLPLWTNFLPGPEPGVLDWYTVLCGVVSLVALGTHGALYLGARTTGPLDERVRGVARLGTILVPIATLGSLVATVAVRPHLLDNFRAHPAGWLIPLAVAASVAAMAVLVRRGREWGAFAASCVYLASMLGGGAFALFPVLLPSSGDPSRSLTIDGVATGSYAMHVAARWWLVAFLLVLAASTYLYRTFRGKIAVAAAHD